MEQKDIWDTAAARSYDTPGTGMFDPELLAATTQRLATLANGGAALEFAIGTGRVAIPLHARDVPVTGIELSEPMIAEFRAKPESTGIPVVVGDMTSAAVPGSFALVYLVYNTISNVLTQSGQVEVFRNAARHLNQGGRFVIELEVPNLRRLPPGHAATVFAAEPGYIGVDTFDTLNQLLVSNHFRFSEQGRDAHVFRSPHRYIWPSEMDLMAQIAGFALESRHADWAGSAFTAESTSHVSVYRLA